MDRQIIKSLTDNDAYKFFMGQIAWNRFSHTIVRYKYKCRDSNINLAPYASQIEEQIRAYCELRFKMQEIAKLRQIRFLKPSYIDALEQYQPSMSGFQISRNGEPFSLEFEGTWFQKIWFEVPVLSIITRVYFLNKMKEIGVSEEQVLKEGRKRLTDKIAFVKANPTRGFEVCEFGTRRRWSAEWQDEVLTTLLQEIGDCISGTSNVGLAFKHGVAPVGTSAHEYQMVCMAHNHTSLHDFMAYSLDQWCHEFQGDVGTALTDILGLEAFCKHAFSQLYAKTFDGFRFDSGDPFWCGDYMLNHLRSIGINPAWKNALWSDNTTFPLGVELAKRYYGTYRKTIICPGTYLTNDMGIFPAISHVIKPIKVNNRHVVKLSDSRGKRMSENEPLINYLADIYQLNLGE